MSIKLAAAVMCYTTAVNVFASPQFIPATTLTSALVSDYLFRGQRLAGLSLQPAVELNTGESVAGIAANFPVRDKDASQSDPEVDFYASHSFSANDEWRIAPGFTFYTYSHVRTRIGYFRSIFEPSIALSHTVAGVRITATCYYDLTRKGPTFELTGAVALPLKTLGTELDLTANLGDYRLRDAFKNALSRKKLWGNYWSFGASVPFQITPASNIRIGVSYNAGFNSYIKHGAAPRTKNPLAARRASAQVGYSLSF